MSDDDPVVGVIGTGLMGIGIAALIRAAGLGFGSSTPTSSG